METEKETGSSGKFDFKWLLIIGVLAVLIYFAFSQNGNVSADESYDKPTEYTQGEENHMEQPIGNKIIPQYSEKNPRPFSVDPFTENESFESLMISNENKSDFDFSIDNQKEVPTYTLSGGEINFEMIGTLLTAIPIENNVPLSIEIYNNDQISFTKRKSSYDFDLPFIKETKKKNNRDKALYSFDFKKTLSVEPGLFYFVIKPTGRNRVLYIGKFYAK